MILPHTSKSIQYVVFLYFQDWELHLISWSLRSLCYMGIQNNTFSLIVVMRSGYVWSYSELIEASLRAQIWIWPLEPEATRSDKHCLCPLHKIQTSQILQEGLGPSVKKYEEANIFSSELCKANWPVTEQPPSTCKRVCWNLFEKPKIPIPFRTCHGSIHRHRRLTTLRNYRTATWQTSRKLLCLLFFLEAMALMSSSRSAHDCSRVPFFSSHWPG